MSWIIPGILAGLFVLWLLLQLKTSRPDGTYLKQTHPYRTMMQYIMPTRTEAVVYYEVDVKAEALLAYVKEAREHFHADITHCLVAATAIGLSKAPEMNRFPLGRRLYQRKGTWLTFSMKRKKLDKKAKLATVKKEFPPNLTFKELCAHISEGIKEQRSDAVTYHDKEYNLLTSLPRPILGFGVRLLQYLDYCNVLPGSFIENDPLYTSAFVANLGSVKMGSAYHHLFEWGNCPVFIMAGMIEKKPTVNDEGELEVCDILPLRITYDERIDDGLTASFGLNAVQQALEDPYTHFGCLKEDGSDATPLGQH